MHPDIIGFPPGDQHIEIGAQRQYAARILEEHERLAHRLAGDRPMLRRAEQRAVVRQRPRRGTALLEQSGTHLNPQDPRHRLINARFGYVARAHLRDGAFQKRFPLGRHHDEIDAGVDGMRAVVFRAALHPIDPVPVADDQPVEAESLLQNIRQ